MRLRDFDLAAGPGYDAGHMSLEGRERRSAINRGSRPVVEEMYYELGANPAVEAPWAKLYVAMAEPGSAVERRARDLVDVAEVTVEVPEAILLAERSTRLPALLDVTEEALRVLERELGWSSAILHEKVEALRRRADELGTIELERLARIDRRTRRRARVFYVIEEDGVAVDVVVEDEGGAEVARERIAESEVMFWLDRLLPVRSAIMRDGVLILRDRNQASLASVDVRAQD
jgi:hypothetical protein